MLPAAASRDLPIATTRPPRACTSFAERREYAMYSSLFETAKRFRA